MTSIEITTSWSQLGFVALSAVAMTVGVIAWVRVIGLRSFSKMSSFDFAVTVSIGSLLASISLSSSSLIEGIVAVGVLLGFQAMMALGRTRFGLGAVVDNEPLLIMAGATVLEDNLRRARMTHSDLHAKLREANVSNYGQVRYVVLETTGDVSVVHGEGEIDVAILDDVVDGHLVTGS